MPGLVYKLCLAGGVCDDISFEEHFCEMYPGIVCYALMAPWMPHPPFTTPNFTLSAKTLAHATRQTAPISMT